MLVYWTDQEGAKKWEVFKNRDEAEDFAVGLRSWGVDRKKIFITKAASGN